MRKNFFLVILICFLLFNSVFFVFAEGGENSEVFLVIESGQFNEEDINAFNSIISEDISLLQDNPVAMKNWLEYYDVQGEDNLEIEKVMFSEEITTITTSGEYSSTIPLQKVSGSTLNSDGSVLLSDGSKIRASTLEFEGEMLSIDGGEIDLTESSLTEVSFKEAKIILNEKTFSSEGDSFSNFKIDQDKMILEGDEIYELDSETGEKKFKFKGNSELFSDGTKFFGSETSFSIYDEGEPSKLFLFEDETFYGFDDCKGYTRCVLEEGNSFVVNIEGSDIFLGSLDDSIDSLKVNKINDEGKFFFDNNKGNEFLFEKSGIYSEGPLSSLNTDLSGSFEVHGKNFEQTYLKGGKFMLQDGEYVGGMYGFEAESENLIYKSKAFDKQAFDKQGETDFFERDTSINKINSELLEGGNLYIREGSIAEASSILIQQNSKVLEDSFKSTFEYSTEIYQFDEKLVRSIGEPLKDYKGYGNTPEEAIANTLTDGLEDFYVSSRISSEILQISSNEESSFKDSFGNHGEVTGSGFIKKYFVTKIKKNEKLGVYTAFLDIEIGELKR